MEVKLDKRYPVQATLEQAWAVLADIHAVARCMPGAQITEQIDATHYKGTVKSKVGPAVMQFGGDIEVLALEPATRSMQMLGKGADKSGSSASMNLSAHLEAGEGADSCVLAGVATIIVSGKLAQFGSRLLVPVSDAMLAQFADNFRAAAAAVPVAAANGGAAEMAPSSPGEALGAAPGAAPEPAGLGAAMASNPAAPASASAAATETATAAAAPAAAHSAQAPAAALPPMARPPMPAPAPVKELNALGLMWTVFKGWLAGLFGKRS